MENEQDLINSIKRLSINQQRIIREVVEELAQQEDATIRVSTPPPSTAASAGRGTSLGPNTGIRRLPRAPNYQFVDNTGTALALGDRVKILNTRRTGRIGDIAEITSFNKVFVAFRVRRTGTIGQRSSFNLQYIE